MSTYDKIAWLPLCGGLTGLGLVLSFLAMRSRGLGSGLRGAAWSLLPLAAYLTGAIEMFWKMGVAIGDFATGFVFSPRVWSGIIVALLSGVLFVVSGPLRRRRRAKRGQGEQGSVEKGRGDKGRAGPAAGSGASRQAVGTSAVPVRAPSAEPAKAPAKRRKADDDDDLGDVADILRRHGIT
jgi:membrane protein implicated in regulation of membrane protease activity